VEKLLSTGYRVVGIDNLSTGRLENLSNVMGTLDGSPIPLGSTATHEPIEIPRSLWGRWKSLDGHRIKNPVDQEAKQHKQKKINDNQCPSRDKRKDRD
jgi:nucleoside-diphosphate-sugar epimerase